MRSSSLPKKFDPQPFHLDANAAQESEYDDIIASGLHTISMSNKLAANALFTDKAIKTGVEIGHVYYQAPVQLGDTIYVVAEVVERRKPESRSDEGLVKIQQRVTEEDRSEVSSIIGLIFVKHREKGL